jgi:hypothetical protein
MIIMMNLTIHHESNSNSAKETQVAFFASAQKLLSPRNRDFSHPTHKNRSFSHLAHKNRDFSHRGVVLKETEHTPSA